MRAWNQSCHWIWGAALFTSNQNSAPFETCWGYHLGMMTHFQGDLWISDLTCQGFLNYFRAIHAYPNGWKRTQLIKSPPRSCRSQKLAIIIGWSRAETLPLTCTSIILRVQEGVMGTYIVSSAEVSSYHCVRIPEATSLKEERFILTQISEDEACGCLACNFGPVVV